MANKWIAGLVVGALIALVSSLALLVILFQILQDMSGIFRYTYLPPWTAHEVTMLVLLVIAGGGTLAGIVVTGISAFAGTAKPAKA